MCGLTLVGHTTHMVCPGRSFHSDTRLTPTVLTEHKKRKKIVFSSSVVVQQMKAANDPSLFFACSQIHLRTTKRQLPSFASAVVEKYELVGEKDEFKRNIVKERKMLKMMLHDKPELGTDLQALISTKSELFFIDLGSHAGWSQNWKELWLKNTKMPDPKECDETFDAINEALNERVL